MSSDGTVRAGFTLGNAPIPDATTVFAATTLADGSTLIGTSPNGKVYKAVGDAITLFADTGALAVTSIVQTKNGTDLRGDHPRREDLQALAGQGRRLRHAPRASHVWALALDKNGTGLFAATGPEGKVFHVEPTASSSVYFRSTEPHLVSLALADNGDLYAGSSGKGHLYSITGPDARRCSATCPAKR